MKTIRLYGDIARDYKSEWQLHVSTPSEALRAIDANRPGFCREADAGHYIAILLDESNPDAMRQVTDKNGLGVWGDEVLVIVPKIEGEITAAILGAIAGSAVASSSGIIAAAGVFLSTYAVGIAAVLNVALAIGVSGIASLISAGPKGDGPQEAPENKPSYLFNGVVNTARQGHRIPVLYGGPLLVGSMVLSSRVNTVDIEL